MSVYIILSDSPLIPSVKLFCNHKMRTFFDPCIYFSHFRKKLMRQIRKTFSNNIPCFLSSAILTSQKKYFCNTLNKVNYIFQFRTHLDYVYTYVDNNVWGLNEWNIKSLFSVPKVLPTSKSLTIIIGLQLFKQTSILCIQNYVVKLNVETNYC